MFTAVASYRRARKGNRRAISSLYGGGACSISAYTCRMVLRKAVEADYAEVIDLANLAYRGREGAVPSWNIEKGIVGGQRLDDSVLKEELAAKPDGALLVYRKEEDGRLLGTAWLNPES